MEREGGKNDDSAKVQKCKGGNVKQVSGDGCQVSGEFREPGTRFQVTGMQKLMRTRRRIANINKIINGGALSLPEANVVIKKDGDEAVLTKDTAGSWVSYPAI